jgi:ribosome recycling factor
METKLTLRLRKSVIEKAKEYAHDQKTSLSKIIETYLDSITSTKKNDPDTTPLVDSLSGVIKLKNDFDYKKEYTNYLTDKHK